MSDYSDLRIIAQLEGYCESGDSGSIGGYWIITNHYIYFVRELEDTEATAMIMKEYIHSIQFESFVGEFTNIIYLTTGNKVNANFWKKQQNQFIPAMQELIPGISFDKKGSVPEPVFSGDGSGTINTMAQIKGNFFEKEGSFMSTAGSWFITADSLFFMKEQDNAQRLIDISIVSIHSILCFSTECHLYLYNGNIVLTDFEKAQQKTFLNTLEQLIPGLLTVSQSTYSASEYIPGISELDPRNPFGTRYNPEYPRGGYIVASHKAFFKDMSSINPAVKAAQDAGILPDDWNPVTDAFDMEHPLAGVPMFFDSITK